VQTEEQGTQPGRVLPFRLQPDQNPTSFSSANIYIDN
jgi:hypothetical protein